VNDEISQSVQSGAKSADHEDSVQAPVQRIANGAKERRAKSRSRSKSRRREKDSVKDCTCVGECEDACTCRPKKRNLSVTRKSKSLDNGLDELAETIAVKSEAENMDLPSVSSEYSKLPVSVRDMEEVTEKSKGLKSHI
jgi:hypothetical protein